MRTECLQTKCVAVSERGKGGKEKALDNTAL